MKTVKAKIAIAYDFDGTLAPGNMQEHQFLPDLHINSIDFWNEVQETARHIQGDGILVYMGLMLEKAKKAGIHITQHDFLKWGQGITLFNGVKTWFSLINQYAKSKNVLLEHYLISSGNEEIIRGTSLYPEFKQVFASKYQYDENGVPIWPALAINYTTKTQYLFRISKGITDISNDIDVNTPCPLEKKAIPFENIIFLGDGMTDIPCFRLLKAKGGMPIAVYNPRDHAAKRKALNYLKENRVDFALSADYSENHSIFQKISERINFILAKNKLYEPL